MRLHRRLEQLSHLGYAAARILIPGGRWQYVRTGTCPSCGNGTVFVFAKGHAEWVRKLSAPWDNSAVFKAGLVIRESNLCGICRANFRVRAQAQTLFDLLGIDRIKSLLAMLRAGPGFRIYEAAHRNVFRDDEILAQPNYVTSEYFEDAQPGQIVDGVMNQNLEKLSFEDGSFDVVMTSEVLEHVADLDRALDEIRRVLKVGGYHIFTVPSDPALDKTVERARYADGKLIHMKAPVLHGDTIRNAGVLAFRDFGSDTTRVTSRPGLPCSESVFSGSSGFITSVFVAQKDE